jgi:CRP-like cAMP-binding protein
MAASLPKDAQAQLHASHHDIRIYFFDTTAAELPTTTTPTATTAPTTSTARIRSHLLAVRQRFQHATTQLATISTDIRRFYPWRTGAGASASAS